MIECIGLASGIGAGNEGCADGPLYFKEHLQLDELSWHKMISSRSNPTFQNKLDLITSLNQELAKEAFELSKKETFFFSFGGDHSSAIGTWSGIGEEKKLKNQELGLLWIDAHMDSHTLETSESGNIHGMPLAALLGYGDKRLTSLLSSNPKIQPENIILIGIRSFEEAELTLLQKLNVKIYFIEEVLKRGFKTVLEEALNTLLSHTPTYGISFDLDVMDPKEIKGTGTVVPNGVMPEDVFSSLEILEKKLPVAFELVEYNPRLDLDKKTFNFSKELLKKVIHLVEKAHTCKH